MALAQIKEWLEILTMVVTIPLGVIRLCQIHKTLKKNDRPEKR